MNMAKEAQLHGNCQCRASETWSTTKSKQICTHHKFRALTVRQQVHVPCWPYGTCILVKNKEVCTKEDIKTRLLRIILSFHYCIHTLTIITHIGKADRQTSTEQDLTTKSFWLSLLITSLLCYCPKKLHTLLRRRLSSCTVSSSGSVKSSESDLSLTTQIGSEVIYHMFQTDHLKSQDHIREFLIVLGFFSFHMLVLFTASLLITIATTWVSNQLSVGFDTFLVWLNNSPIILWMF
jgi:hypothetical protein